MRKLKSLILNLCLFSASLVVCVALLELGLRYSAESFPLSLRDFIPKDVAIISQSSKQNRVPRDYVAIFGDSFAAGAGDWFFEATERQPFGKPAYHSSHVIHDALGRDVVSFGQSGAGSFDGIVYYPIRRLERLRGRNIAIPDPSIIVVYFYEGNDLNNNLDFLSTYLSKTERADLGASLEKRFSELLRTDSYARSGIVKTVMAMPVLGDLHTFSLALGLWHTLKTLVLGEGEDGANTTAGPTKFAVGGNEITVDLALQSPAMELDDTDVEDAMLVFRAALKRAARHFKDARILVAYLPSPLSVYEIASETAFAQTYHDGRSTYDRERIYARTRSLAAQAATIARELNLEFVDIGPELRAKTRQVPVHGPRDWRHYNRIGYEILGQAIARKVREN